MDGTVIGGYVTKIKIWTDGSAEYAVTLNLPGQPPMKGRLGVKDGEFISWEPESSVLLYGEDLNIPWNDNPTSHNQN